MAFKYADVPRVTNWQCVTFGSSLEFSHSKRESLLLFVVHACGEDNWKTLNASKGHLRFSTFGRIVISGASVQIT